MAEASVSGTQLHSKEWRRTRQDGLRLNGEGRLNKMAIYGTGGEVRDQPMITNGTAFFLADEPTC
jgi:hypothetical protein